MAFYCYLISILFSSSVCFLNFLHRRLEPPTDQCSCHSGLVYIQCETLCGPVTSPR
jgi:hypothetical protein